MNFKTRVTETFRLLIQAFLFLICIPGLILVAGITWLATVTSPKQRT